VDTHRFKNSFKL